MYPTVSKFHTIPLSTLRGENATAELGNLVRSAWEDTTVAVDAAIAAGVQYDPDSPIPHVFVNGEKRRVMWIAGAWHQQIWNEVTRTARNQNPPPDAITIDTWPGVCPGVDTVVSSSVMW